jgi:hypothetical protein
MRSRRAALVIALLLATATVSAQSPKRSFDLGGQRLPSADDLVEQIGSDADASAIVSMVLQDVVNRPKGIRVDRVRLFRAQVHPAWLL